MKQTPGLHIKMRIKAKIKAASSDTHRLHATPLYTIIIIYYTVVRQRGAVAEYLEHATDDGFVADSNPSGAASKLGTFYLPHIACVFRMRHYMPLVHSIQCLCQGI